MYRSIRRFYKVMNRDEYRDNQRLATMARKIDKVEMPGLLGPDGYPVKGDEHVVLHAVPEVPIYEENYLKDPYYQTLWEFKPDLIFLQFNPMHYIAKQRYVVHKLAMKGEDDYNIKATYSFDNPVPLTWDECCVNLITLDMIRQNKTHDELELRKSLATYSYTNIQAQSVRDSLTEPFIQSIKDLVAGNEYSKYLYLNQILFLGLMGKSKIVLGDMPEPLLRQQLGNTLPLSTVQDMYEFVLEKITDHYKHHPDVPMTMEDVTLLYFPHIFQTPRDLYQTALLKESMKASICTAAFVGAPHYIPVQRYWVGPPAGINYTQATYIPERIPNETDEMLIEKQVLFDLMLDTKVWGSKYIVNPFPYLAKSIEDFSESDLAYYKRHFLTTTQKYTHERNKKVGELQSQPSNEMLINQLTTHKSQMRREET